MILKVSSNLNVSMILVQFWIHQYPRSFLQNSCPVLCPGSVADHFCSGLKSIRAAIWSVASARHPLAFASSRSLGKSRGPGPAPAEGSPCPIHPLNVYQCVAQSLPEPRVASSCLKAFDRFSCGKFDCPLALSKCLLMIQAICPMCQDNF